MTTIATIPSHAEGAPGARARLGLSGRLILLTMLFLMLAQVLVYLPSVAHFRRSWVNDRVMSAQMIALAFSSIPQDARSPELEDKLLAGIKGAQAILVKGPSPRWLSAGPGDGPPPAARVFDLRDAPWWLPLRGLARNISGDVSPAVRIVAPPAPDVPGSEGIELVLREELLWRATIGYTQNFVLVSLIISAIVGMLLYLALHLLVVRPMQRLAGSIAGFASSPEDSARVIAPSGRQDEIGLAEEALARMQTSLAGELRQKRRLAELGLAVSKINHELRNMLTTAQLLGDRLGAVENPAVQRITPRLIRTLDRAIQFCGATLAYGRASEPAPQRRLIALKPLVEEQLDLTQLSDGVTITVASEIAPDLKVDADPDQLARVLLNLMRNSVEALSQAKVTAARITVSGERRNGSVRIRVADNGPGVPERIRTRLFSAFQASERSGGTGLGLPVADELVRLHGGSIVLESGTDGASFLVTIPDRTAANG